MKNRFKNNEKISHVSAIILIISGFFALFIIFYKSLFLINENSKNKNLSLKNKLIIEHDFSWYKKQKKYIKNSKIIPVEFDSCIKQSENNLEAIKRHGILLINDNAKATILVCHGFMSSKDDMHLLRIIFSDYNVMSFDFRAHGENCHNQNCTFGDDERYDVIGAVNFIKNHPLIKDKPLFAYGFSMGAVAIIMALNEIKDLFNGIILDCPFESTDNLVERAFERMKVNLYGFNISIPGGYLLKKYAYNMYLQEILKVLFKIFSRMDATRISTIIKKVSPKEAIKNVDIPLFLIGCHNDEKAPPSAIREIYENASLSVYKRLWISCGRRHFDSFFVNPEKYTYKLKSFLNTIMDKSFENKIKEKTKEDPCIYKIKN